MRNKILSAISFMALVAAMPALAQTAKSQTQINAEKSTNGASAADTKKTTVWEGMKTDTAEAYEKIKATIIGDGDVEHNVPVVIDSRTTAAGIIGHKVYNEKHEDVAKVTDIILDNNGQAVMVVVSDSSFLGLGKDAAFDYSAITRVESDGDVIMPLTERIIEDAASFSYNREDVNDDTRVMPNDGYSVARLLKGRLLNQRREAVADIENISFQNGRASQIIVGFDKTLGFGGERAVFSYNDAQIVRNGDALDFQLSTDKSTQFEVYKNSIKNY